jgi:type IV secretory pathway VirB2 component (pilin)
MNPGAAAPAGASVFAAAVQWLQGTLLGTVATTVAIIAVASIGFLLLSGRIDLRRGAQVVFGCFILFGASTIAGGIVHVAADAEGAVPAETAPPPPQAYLEPASTGPIKAVPYDPYAGAALPTRR